MERKIFTVTTIICLITFFGIIAGASAETIDIEGPWLWMIAPVPFNQGGAASIHLDSLNAVSCSVVTEQMIATNGANAGDPVGNYQWTPGKISVERPGWIDLGDGNINDILNATGMITGNVDHATAYALIYIESSVTQAATIKVGSDDAIKVWLNGVAVHTNAINRSTTDYQDAFGVNLNAGDNLLLVKVSEQERKWRMFVGVDVPNPQTLDFHIPQPPPGMPPIKNRPVVRLIHFVPSGKTYNLNKKHEELKKKMEHVKAFYQCTMRDYGHITFDVNNSKRSGKTFMYDETPYVVHSKLTENDWRDRIADDEVYESVWQEIQDAWDPTWGDFDPTTDIYLVMMEGNYEDGVAGRADVGNGRTIVYSVNWRTIAHELGHTFGLRHNFGDARYVMSYCNHTVWDCDTTWDHNPIRDIIGFFSTDECDDYDFDNRVISEETADWLTVHQAFNPPPVTTDTPATIEIVEPTNGILLRGTTTFPLVVHHADNDQPHQIQLYVPVTEAEKFAEGMKLYKAHTFPAGHTGWNITYPNFSDIMVDRDIMKINIRAIDSYGNMTSTEHTLIKEERADVDKNGTVNAADAAIVDEILKGREPFKPGVLNATADVNGDGKVSSEDLTLVENAKKATNQHRPVPVVRLYYVYKDEEPNDQTRKNFVSWTEAAQEFYRTEMERNGFGRKTFQLDTEVRLKEWHAEKELKEIQTPDEIQKAFGPYIHDEDGLWDTHLFFAGDIDDDENGSDVAAFPQRIAYITTKKDEDYPATIIAHELGHTFGFLGHMKSESANINGTDKFPIMSINCPDPSCDTLANPIEKQILLDYQAKWLNKHPLFNNHPILDGTKTEFFFLNLKKVEIGTTNTTVFEFIENNPSSVKFEVKDEDGIYMIMRLYLYGNIVEYYHSPHAAGLREVEVNDDEIITNFTKTDYGTINVRILVMDNLGNIEVWGYPGNNSNLWQIQKKAAGAPSLVSSPSIETTLLRNYPNPFNPETWIPYQLSEPADVTLTICDIQGRVVRDLNLGHQRAGMYHSRSRAAHWDGRNAVGEPVASGLYFYTLKADDFTATRKMLIRK